jgi:hypothetical protein
MLTSQEQQSVCSGLAEILSELDSFKAFVQTTFGTQAKQILLQIPNNLNRPQDQAACLLGCCLDNEWTVDPPLLGKLLSKLVTEGKAEFVTLRDRVNSHLPAPDDPFLKHWINSTMPFFDRQTLRDHLRPLLRCSDQPILRINGPGGCGKSYSREFFDHLAEEARRDLHIVYVPLEREMGPSFPAEELAEALVTPTTVSIKERPLRSTSYYPRALARWVLNSAMQTPGTWIYALDGFDQQDILSETRDLVQLLAQEISAGEFRRHFRMILIDYRSSVRNVLAARILDEEISDSALITEDHVLDCLVAHYDEFPPSNGLQTDRDELRKVAQTLVRRAPASGRGRLEALYAELNRLRQTSSH